MAGLFGLGGIGAIGGAQPPAGLLGPYFNPADMRKQMLKQGLLAAGIGLLTGGKGSTGEVLGQGLAAGLQGANNAGINYKQDAMGYQKIAQDMEEQKAKREEKENLMKWVSTLPPKDQMLARQFPEKYAEYYLKSQNGGEGAGNFGNMIWGSDEAGNDAVFLPPKQGNVAQQLQFPNGIRPNPGVQFLDNGTFYDPRNKRTGLPQSGAAPIQKDIAGVQTQEEIGTNTGKKIAAAPNDIAAADTALEIIDSLRKDPNKAWGTGASSIFNAIPGSPGKSYQKKVDQATAGAFMTGIQAMRGMGALSDAEGRRASDAVARMDTATTEAEFDAALNDYEVIVRKAKAKAQSFLPGQSAPTQNQTPRLRFNPQTGDFE